MTKHKNQPPSGQRKDYEEISNQTKRIEVASSFTTAGPNYSRKSRAKNNMEIITEVTRDKETNLKKINNHLTVPKEGNDGNKSHNNILYVNENVFNNDEKHKLSSRENTITCSFDSNQINQLIKKYLKDMGCVLILV